MLKELPKETKVELRMMETWQICLITSLEETELLDHDLLNL